jgi:hypothetical protein
MVMTGFDSAADAQGLVIGLIEKAVSELDAMSNAAGDIAPNVGDLSETLVNAQRIADRASLELRRLTKKIEKSTP